MNAGNIKSGENFTYKGKQYQRVTPERWGAMKKSWNIKPLPVPDNPNLFLISHQNCICVENNEGVYFLNCWEPVDLPERSPQIPKGPIEGFTACSCCGSLTQLVYLCEECNQWNCSHCCCPNCNLCTDCEYRPGDCRACKITEEKL